MKIHSLIAACALVATAAVPALAQSPWHRDDDRYGRRAWRYERDLDNTQINPNNSVYVGPLYSIRGPRGRLSPLTEPTRIDSSREDFLLQGRPRVVSELELHAVAGRSYIQRVTIQYMDGSAQIVNVNGYLDGRNRVIPIEVERPRRGIKRILVYGWSGNRAAYQLYARR